MKNVGFVLWMVIFPVFVGWLIYLNFFLYGPSRFDGMVKVEIAINTVVAMIIWLSFGRLIYVPARLVIKKDKPAEPLETP